LLISVVTTNC